MWPLCTSGVKMTIHRNGDRYSRFQQSERCAGQARRLIVAYLLLLLLAALNDGNALAQSQPQETPPSHPVAHAVAAGETLSEIAQGYGIPLADLLAYNGITDADSVRVGRELRLPPSSPSEAVDPADPTQPAETQPGGQVISLNRTTTVRPDDNLSLIALRYGVDLSALLARTRNRAVGTRTTAWSEVRRFLVARFPAALYRLRWWWLGTLAANVVVTAVLIVWLLQHPAVEQSLLTPEQVDQLVNEDVEGYYSEFAASHFALSVWVNNAWVAGLCLALGVFGLPVVYVLFQNILNLAIIGSIMTRHGHGGHFWGLILPHGLLELTAVFVAAGTPRPRRRRSPRPTIPRSLATTDRRWPACTIVSTERSLTWTASRMAPMCSVRSSMAR